MLLKQVLILVLVDHTLGVVGNGTKLKFEFKVLILVLVDHTLGVTEERTSTIEFASLNPCFSGPYSRSHFEYTFCGNCYMS